MNSGDHQRKVHIGNDLVVIVFIDTDIPFSPKYIHTTFNQAYILVSVERDDSVKKKVSKLLRELKKKESPKSPRSSSDQFSENLLLDSDDISQLKDSGSKVKRGSQNIKTKKKLESHNKRASTQNLRIRKKSTYYRVKVLRREDVPVFKPDIPEPYPVFRDGSKFRNWILEKAISAIKASYQSQSFQDRIQINRKQFLESFARKY